MGAQLVAQVLAGWTDVSNQAFRVLVRMALTALDKPQNGHPAGIYRGGRELLAMTLRGDGTDETKFRAVKRAVAELTELGAIEHIATGWTGQKAVYRLTLSRREAVAVIDEEGGSIAPPSEDLTDMEMGGQYDPPKGGSIGPPKGGQNMPERGVNRTPPRNQEEVLKELQEENWGSETPASHRSRATGPRPKKPSPSSPRCEHGLDAGNREDGRPACALCRVAEDRPATRRPPPDSIAAVIQLEPRRTA